MWEMCCLETAGCMWVVCFPVRHPVTEFRGRVVLVTAFGNLLLGDWWSLCTHLGAEESPWTAAVKDGLLRQPLSPARVTTGRDGRRECLCLLMFKWHTET